MEHLGVAAERGEPTRLLIASTVCLEPSDQRKQLVLLGRHPLEEPGLETAQFLLDEVGMRQCSSQGP